MTMPDSSQGASGGTSGREKIIFKHLDNYLLRYNILSDDQSGFRHRDSTKNQLLVIYDIIMKNLDIGKDVRFIFCEISKVWNSK
jgi:hypothetical protein